MAEDENTSQSCSEASDASVTCEMEMPWPAYSEAFQVQTHLSNDKNHVFLCKLCTGKKFIHASKSSTANLKKHLHLQDFQGINNSVNLQLKVLHKRAKHPFCLKNIKKTQLENLKRKNEDVDNSVPKKQMLEKWRHGSSIATQKMLDTAILRFIIEEIQPLSIVDSPAFIDLIKIGIPSTIRVMCRKTLKEKLSRTYFEMKSALENKLAEIEIVSTTTDLWSKAKRSYLGMTVHWINPETLIRESAALACRRMQGKHTYDILAKEINSVFLEYHIQNKVCCTTTDNGSNFVKAFRTFQKDENEDDEESVQFYNINDLLTTDDEKNISADDVILPPHHRCVSHTLNLVAVKDSEKALDNASYKKQYRMTFAKLSKLWSKQNQSTQVADKIKEMCSVYLKTPVITRWNSTYDSVSQLVSLLKVNSEKINKCMDFCSLQRLSNDEIKFLEEYCEVMSPLARALDILQSDTGMYMGYLLPVLSTLQQRMENMNKDGLVYCRSLVVAIQIDLNKRFHTVFDKKELIIASCLHPKFKFNWLAVEKRKLAESYLEELLGIRSNENSPSDNNIDDNDDFFVFKQQTYDNSAQDELHQFLNSTGTNIETLNAYPKIKELFIKYNTALPSSASVERLFSVSGLILTPQRSCLHDDTIEHQLLLKVNKAYR